MGHHLCVLGSVAMHACGMAPRQGSSMPPGREAEAVSMCICHADHEWLPLGHQRDAVHTALPGTLSHTPHHRPDSPLKANPLKAAPQRLHCNAVLGAARPARQPPQHPAHTRIGTPQPEDRASDPALVSAHDCLKIVQRPYMHACRAGLRHIAELTVVAVSTITLRQAAWITVLLATDMPKESAAAAAAAVAQACSPGPNCLALAGRDKCVSVGQHPALTAN